MKYADCPTATAEVVINATPAAVWDAISDISLPTRFSSELVGVEWLDGLTGPSVGATFTGRSQHAAIGEWQTQCVVTACDPQRCFEWSVGDASNPSSIWRFTISPVDGDPGSVHLEQWFQMGPARSGLNMAIDAMPDKEEKIVSRRMGEHRTNMEATLAGIKALIEGQNT